MNFDTDFALSSNTESVILQTRYANADSSVISNFTERSAVVVQDNEGMITDTKTQAVPKTALKSDSSNKKLIALTFDDGPSETTSLVLDKLEKYNVVASFFLVGQNITDTTKSILQRELSLGCEINNHSYTHSCMNTMSEADIIDEIQKTNDVIYNMIGVWPKFFRPPYIATSNTMYEAIDKPFICGIGCNDWDSSVSAQTRVETILNNVKDGDIVLLHDSCGNTLTVEALDTIIPELLDKGYTFVTVSQLFEQKGIEPNVEYKIWTNVLN